MRGLLVGLTGGIASGKSTALAEFARLGAATVSLDAIAKDVVRPGSAGLRKVVRAFGKRMLAADGTLDRAKLAREVFSRPGARRLLERRLHPLILKEMDRRVAAAGRDAPVIVDVPLLFEKGLEKRFDVSLLVTAGRETRIRRVGKRDGLSRAQIERRLAAQLPQKAKSALADVVLDNGGTRSALKSKVRQYYRSFQLMSTTKPS